MAMWMTRAFVSCVAYGVVGCESACCATDRITVISRSLRVGDFLARLCAGASADRSHATSANEALMLMSASIVVREDRDPYRVSRWYEDEGSERTSTGAINLTPDAAWRATLSVPLPGADAVFLRIERTGPLPDGYVGAEESAGLSVPVKELDTVMALLAGVIAQARRHGVVG
ncbi:MAG: hypothetical protein HOQ14_16505 [Gemmatimonadaceae bacterium]|nr:hypothetical protein [Gemmatimonadaceae bacterium]